MSGLAACALTALKAWIAWRGAMSIDEVRSARIEFDKSESALGGEFMGSNLRFATLNFGEWTVYIEARERYRSGGLEQAFPLITYRKG